MFDEFVGARRPGNRRRISEPDAPAQIATDASSLAPVSEPGTVGSGIQLATVLSFIDIAVDALAGAREEIDALNVYPVPDGDTGTNMYLTMAAARDAVREKAASGGRRPGRPVRGVHPRRPAGRARQLRRDPQRDAPRDHRGASPRRSRTSGTARSWSTRCGRRPRRATPPSVRRSRAPCSRSAAPPRTRPRSCSRASRRSGRATCSPPAPPRPARRSRGRPTSCRSLRDAGVVDAGGRGVVVILDAAETALTGKRPPPVEAGRRIPQPDLGQPASPSRAPTWWTAGRRTR